MEGAEKKFWIDCLSEKHECWTYERFRTTIPVRVGRREIQLHLPSGFDKFEILFAAERKGILFIIARNLSEWAQDMWCDGILMVAKRLEDGSYAVAIWHELYGYALDHFGLR